MKKLVTGCAVTASAWIALYRSPSTPVGTYNAVDKFIIHEITAVFLFAALVMLFSRRTWTWRAVGLFLTSLGTTAVYLSTVYVSHGGSLASGTREALVDLGRAGLGIGGILVFAGLLFYVRDRFREHDELFETPLEPGEDRRVNIRRDCDRQLLRRLEAAEIDLSRYRGRFGELEAE